METSTTQGKRPGLKSRRQTRIQQGNILVIYEEQSSQQGANDGRQGRLVPFHFMGTLPRAYTPFQYEMGTTHKIQV